jgi:hypothetical protein
MLRTHEREIETMDEAALEEMRRRISLANLPGDQRERLYAACDRREAELARRLQAMAQHGDIEVG